MEHLDKALPVPFERLYLDPNNPRLGQEQPGYDDPDKIFPKEVQDRLEKQLEEAYDGISNLMDDILRAGWMPVDNIFVWEHPHKKGHYVVVEGNTRTTGLRNIRRRLLTLEIRFEKEKKKKNAPIDEDLEAELEQYRQVVKDTEELYVIPIKAAGTKELREKLPIVLGVRHITPAKGWKPAARSNYVFQLYRERFVNKYGNKAKLTLDKDLIQETGKEVSLEPKNAKLAIQSACAFNHFKFRYEDKVPAVSPLSASDHYFFEQILKEPWPRQQFKFSNDDLHLENEMEEVLFKWAFKLPRSKGKDNPNILYQAESIRSWAKMKRYDEVNGTSFASRLDVNDPDNATEIEKVEAEFLTHKTKKTPVAVLESLLTSFKQLEAETLRVQAAHIVPMLEEMMKLAEDYLKMIKAIPAKG